VHPLSQRRWDRHPRVLDATRPPPPASDERKRKPVKVEEVHDAEDAAILEAVMARSLQDLVPADNAMPLDQACAWSREQWEQSVEHLVCLRSRLGNWSSPRQIYVQSGLKLPRISAWGGQTSGDALRGKTTTRPCPAVKRSSSELMLKNRAGKQATVVRSGGQA
jgi:hypothetical protein